MCVCCILFCECEPWLYWYVWAITTYNNKRRRQECGCRSARVQLGVYVWVAYESGFLRYLRFVRNFIVCVSMFRCVNVCLVGFFKPMCWYWLEPNGAFVYRKRVREFTIQRLTITLIQRVHLCVRVSSFSMHNQFKHKSSVLYVCKLYLIQVLSRFKTTKKRHTAATKKPTPVRSDYSFRTRLAAGQFTDLYRFAISHSSMALSCLVSYVLCLCVNMYRNHIVQAFVFIPFRCIRCVP